MSRQNALAGATLPKDSNGLVVPVEMSNIIPTAKQEKESRVGRDRRWEKQNPSSSYRIPLELQILASDIRAFILDKAKEKMTSTAVVANAMMTYALGHVRQGKLFLQPRPKPDRRKMALVMVEVNEWPQVVKNKTVWKTAKEKAPSFVLTYRWNKENNVQIKALAGTAISEGELVVFLLNFALEGCKSGHLQFKEETVTTSQIVSATW